MKTSKRQNVETSEHRNRIRESFGDASFAIRYSSFAIPSRRSALSMVETLVSILLVGGLIVVSLDTFGNAARGQKNAADYNRAQLLAADLLAEIMQRPYHEPDYKITELGVKAELGVTLSGTLSVTFGVDAGESSTDRSTFDDVDDYHNWSESPPKYLDGTNIPGFDGWRRRVVVHYVDPDALNQVVASDKGAKRIMVIVDRNGVEKARMVGVKTGTPVTPLISDPIDPETTPIETE